MKPLSRKGGDPDRRASRALIFVIEDDRDSREMLCDLLTHEGKAAIAASSRGEAVEIIAKGARPTAIITDLMMPDMDLETFLEKLLVMGLGDVPLIIVSGASERHAPAPPAYPRFMKPIDLDLLLATLDELAVARHDSATRKGSLVE